MHLLKCNSLTILVYHNLVWAISPIINTNIVLMKLIVAVVQEVA